MTGRSANVFYEVGYAHAKNKTCVLLTADASHIPFDLKHHRHIVYGTSIVALKTKLGIDLHAIKAELQQKENPIVVELRQITGYLENSKWSSTARIELILDLHNRTANISPELETMYLHCGDGWVYEQDGQVCPYTTSDLGYDRRFLIRPPVRRLASKDGWAQIKLSGTKTLAYVVNGEPLADRQRFAGHVLARVVTSGATFDYKLALNVTISEIPF